MSYDPLKPFNTLPALPPKTDVETLDILRDCIDARSKLAELNGAAIAVPNPQILIDFFALREAQASSGIENVVTTGELLYRLLAIGEEQADYATREAARYRPAMFKGVAMLRDRPVLSTELFTKICTEIVGYDTSVRTHEVQLKNQSTGEVVYTPPQGQTRVLKLLNNLQDFIHTPSNLLDPLIRLAVFHYQFEAIHPFPDGNGRTGRVLNILYLIQCDLLAHPILYLSRYFQRHRSEYYSKLRAVTREDAWEDWIRFVLRGISDTATEARDQIAQIVRLRTDFGIRAQSKAPHAAAAPLLDLLFERPYCTAKMVQEVEKVHRHTALTHLRALESIGLLDSMKIGRWRLFVNRELINILKQ